MARTPSEWLRWYRRERDQLGAPGFNPVMQEGRYYFKTCRAMRRTTKGTRARCGSKLKHATVDGNYVCGRCGAAWPFEIRVQLKGAFQVSRRVGASEARLTTLVEVGHLIERMHRSRRWRWQMRCFWAVTFGLRWDLACSQMIRAPFAWTKSRFYKLAVEGRVEFRRRLLLADLKVSSLD